MSSPPKSRGYVPSPRKIAQRDELAKTAGNTLAVLPDILTHRKDDIKALRAKKMALGDTVALHPEDCPGYSVSSSAGGSAQGIRVRVINEDSLDAAISLSASRSKIHTNDQSKPGHPRVAVLNLASEKSPGGGWMKGALAQEEALCYRSSLALSLDKKFYPIEPQSGLYTPDVVIIRSSYGNGHQLLSPPLNPRDLPAVSVISVAAIRRPALRMASATLHTSSSEASTPQPTSTTSTTLPENVDDSNNQKQDGSGKNKEKFVLADALFVDQADRVLTKDKMRLVLRMAALHNHRRLVLGALGCGAFKNPAGEVARAWAEVLQETEFHGGWWEEIVFAVLDNGDDGNFEPFRSALDGLIV